MSCCEMLKMLPILWFSALAVCFVNADDECTPPDGLDNGQVIGYVEQDFSWVGQYKCNAGFILVGASKAKCRNGVWSSSPPVCTAVGKCDRRGLPRVKYSRLVMNKEFRGAVWRYKCKKGYTRYGEGSVYCDGDSWNIFNPPICAKSGCDMSAVSELRYGEAKPLNNAIIKFSCEEGASLFGSSLVWCNGRKWNDSIPECHKAASEPTLSLSVNGEELDLTQGGTGALVAAGEPVTILCKGTGGFPEPLISIFIDEVEMNPSQEFMNSFTFTPESHHLNSQIVCSAKNNVKIEPVTSIINLKVKYNAESVVITSSGTGLAGELATVQCTSSPGYPIPYLYFQLSQGVEIVDEIIENQKVANGAFVSTVERTFVLPENLDSIDVKCLTEEENVFNTTTIQIQRACEKPEFDTELDIITAMDGEVVRLMCTANNGNPIPEVKISMDDVLLGSGIRVAHAELLISSDINGKVVECSAINTVMEEPLTTTKDLQILYGPSEVSVYTEAEVSYGNDIEATCTAGSSNPPSQMFWTIIQDGVKKENDNTEEFLENISITPDVGVQEVVIKCTAQNHVGVKSQEKHIQILYPVMELEITGVEEAAIGSDVRLTCSSTHIQPPAHLIWQVIEDGEEMDYSVVESDSAHSSSIVFIPSEGAQSIEAICTTDHFLEAEPSHHSVSFIYPDATTEAKDKAILASADTESIEDDSEYNQVDIDYTQNTLMVDSTDVGSHDSSTDPTLNAEAVDIEVAANVINPGIKTEAEIATENMMLEAAVNVRISHLEEAADQATVAYEMIPEDNSKGVGSAIDNIRGDDKDNDNTSKENDAIYENNDNASENNDAIHGDNSIASDDNDDVHKDNTRVSEDIYDLHAANDNLNYHKEYPTDNEYLFNDEYAYDDNSEDSTEIDDYNSTNEESEEEYSKQKTNINNFNERMSSDEAHKDNSNHDIFSDEKPKIEVRSKTNGIESLSQQNDETRADKEHNKLRKSPKSLRQLYSSSSSSSAPTINQSLVLILFINMAVRAIS